MAKTSKCTSSTIMSKFGRNRCNGIEVCQEQTGTHFFVEVIDYRVKGSHTTGLGGTRICVLLQDVIYFLVVRTSSDVHENYPDELAGCSEPALQKCSQYKDSLQKPVC